MPKVQLLTRDDLFGTKRTCKQCGLEFLHSELTFGEMSAIRREGFTHELPIGSSSEGVFCDKFCEKAYKGDPNA